VSVTVRASYNEATSMTRVPLATASTPCVPLSQGLLGGVIINPNVESQRGGTLDPGLARSRKKHSVG